MDTKLVLDLFQNRFEEIAADDDKFGNTPDVQKIADAREEIARQLRDAEGNFSLTTPDATNAEIVATLTPIQDAAKARLAALPPSPVFTPLTKVLAELAVISEFIALVPADDSVPSGDGSTILSGSARLGDTVLYTDPHGNGPMPALVSAVHGDGLVNLATFSPDGGVAPALSVPFSRKLGSKGRWTHRGAK